MSGDALWLENAVPRPAAPLRLVCLPHAGGSAGFFRGWGAALPEYDVSAVRYPGRAERIAEETSTDLITLAAEIADVMVIKDDDRPVALFGHSMGAAVAFETARAMQSRGAPPLHLFASGSRDTDELNTDRGKYVEQDPSTVAEQLVRLGGTDRELAEDIDFQELVHPYVNGDGRMFHDYELRLSPRLACPVTTIVGDADTDADARPWHRLTTAEFREYVVPGDHFYLIAEPPHGVLRAELGIACPADEAPENSRWADDE